MPCKIAWRPVPGLPQGKAQNGTAIVVDCDGRTVELHLAVRPARSMRNHRPTLALSINDNSHLFAPTMRECKGRAERLLRTPEKVI